MINLILFGRITGLFATKSYENYCNSTEVLNRSLSFHDIQLNIFTNEWSHNYAVSTIPTLMPSFEAKVMFIVQLLFST